jgi:DNA-binding XRE family transcriptional regulator
MMRDTACRSADLDLGQPPRGCQGRINVVHLSTVGRSSVIVVITDGDRNHFADSLLPFGVKRRGNPVLPLIGYKMDIRSVDDIRQLVRAERKRRRLSQARASGLTGFSQKWLSEFELGRVNPPIDMVLKIMATLGIKLKASVAETPDLDGGDDEEISL